MLKRPKASCIKDGNHRRKSDTPFFYGLTLGEATITQRISYARTPRKLPVILSADEVVQFLQAVSSLSGGDDPLSAWNP